MGWEIRYILLCSTVFLCTNSYYTQQDGPCYICRMILMARSVTRHKHQPRHHAGSYYQQGSFRHFKYIHCMEFNSPSSSHCTTTASRYYTAEQLTQNHSQLKLSLHLISTMLQIWMGEWRHDSIYSPPKNIFFALAGRQTVYCLLKNCASEENIYSLFLLHFSSFSRSTKIMITYKPNIWYTQCNDKMCSYQKIINVVMLWLTFSCIYFI
jgi:hypothetical protein